MSCFTQEDKCIEYTGPSDPSIKIYQGMKQSEFNAQIVSVLSDLKRSIDECKCSSAVKANMDNAINLSNELYKSYTSSKCQSEITNRTVNYSYANSVFGYDVRSVVDALPQGFALEYCRVRLTKNNITIANLSGISSGVTLTAAEVPVNVKIEVRINSSCGQILLEKSFIVENTVNSSSILDIQDSGSQYNLKTQSDFNDLIYNRVLKLEASV